MYARLLFWSMRYRKGRNLQAAVTIAITVSIIMLFVSVVGELMSLSQTSPMNGMTRIVTEPTMYTADFNGFPETLKKRLQGVEGVKIVQCFKPFGGRHDSGTRYIIVGEEDSGVDLNRDFFPVTPDVYEAFTKEKPLGAIAGEGVAKDLNLRVGQTVELPTPHGAMQLKIVGISHGGLFGYRIAAHIEYVQQFIKLPGVCDFRVFADPKEYERAVRGIVEATKTTPTPMQAYNASKLTSDMVKEVAFIPALLGLLGVFLLLTTGLTLANSSAIAIRERRIETSTMRVLGFKPRLIIALLIGEAIVVGVVGAVIAIVVSKLVLGNGVQLAPGASAGVRVLQHVTISKLGMLVGAIVAIAVPVLGTLPSAIAAMRAPLSQALRDSA